MIVSRRSFLTLLVSAPALVRRLSEPAELEHPELAEDVQRPFTRERLRGVALDSPTTRNYALVFGPDDGFEQVVDPGRIARFIARPQTVFRPDRLLLALYECWDVLGVSAEGEPQLDQVVNGSAFAAEAFGARMGFRTVHVGADLVMCVHNKSSAPQPFNAALIGRALA